jgi:hypothetical protein
VFAAFGKDIDHRREGNSAGVTALSGAFADQRAGSPGRLTQGRARY